MDFRAFPKGISAIRLNGTATSGTLIDDRIGYTLLLGACSLLVMLVLSIPIGIYSATHQYSLGDTLLSALAFLGLSIPGFLLALIWLYVGGILLHLDVMGEQSQRVYQPALDHGQNSGTISCTCGPRRSSWDWRARRS